MSTTFLESLDLDSPLYQHVDKGASAPEAGYSPVVPKDEMESVHFQLQWESLGYFAASTLRGPPEAPYNGKFLVGEHHQEWFDVITEHKRACFLCSRDHGKCQVKGSLILSADGKRIPVESWEGGEVWSLNTDTHKFEKAYAPAVGAPFKERCLRVTTRTGRKVEVTVDHPLRSFGAWKPAQELEVGERIAVPKKLPVFGNTQVTDAWLVGLLVGDGGMTGANVVLSNADESILRKAASFSELRHSGAYDYRLPNMQSRMRELGLMGKDSYTKRVPDVFFSSSKDSICQFLAGLLDADGHINPHGGGSVEYYSVSEDLMRDVSHLLMRLGIVAVLSRKKGRYRGQEHLSWRLTIRGNNILTFAEAITPVGAKREPLRLLAKAQAEKLEGGSVDLLPKEVYSLLNKSSRWHREHTGTAYTRSYELTRTKAVALAKGEHNEKLESIANSDVLWDQIVSIEDLGEQEFYPITVPTLRNYVSDDVVNHNTYAMNFAFPLWMAWKNPGRVGAIFSATEKQAIRILDDIRNEIETNPALAHLLPKKKEKWSGATIKLANGHTIYALSWGAKSRGLHPLWCVCDDVLNDEDAWSDTTRNRNIDYFYNAVSPMIVPGGWLLVVGTPFHPNDLYGDLSLNETYFFKKYPAVNPDGTALWPERYDAARLEEKKKELRSPIRFSREFLCEPVSDEASLFPTAMFRGTPVEQYGMRLGMPLEVYKEAGIQIYMGVDFALSANIKADYTVLWTMGVDSVGNRWIIDVVRAKGLSYGEQKSLIVSQARKYDPELIFLEAVQAQSIFGKELIQETDLPIKNFHTSAAGKNSMEHGLPALRVLLENRKLRIPRGDRESVQLMDEFISEMGSFTVEGGKVKSVGQHDDLAMAFWICNMAIKAGHSITFSFDGEFEEEVVSKLPQGAVDSGDIIDPSKDAVENEESAPVKLALDDDVDYMTGQKTGKDDWKPQESIPMFGANYWKY